MKKIIGIGIAILLLIIGAVALFFGLKDKDKDDETLPSADPSETYTFVGYSEFDDKATTSGNNDSSHSDVTENNTVQLPSSKEDILAFAAAAINKTKDFKGNMTVKHTQSFDIAITDVPGGEAVRKVANSVVESIAKPIDETLKFSNGTAKGSDGESLTMLLPLNARFALTADGVISADIKSAGANTVVTLSLAEETGSINTLPKHHSVSVGHMDIKDVDFGPVKMKKFDVNYYDTVVTLTINSDGYVVNAVYEVPFKVDCIGSVSVIVTEYDANVKLEGKQYEVWTITG